MVKLSKKQLLKRIVNKTNLEENLSEVEKDSDKYYSVIENYGITNKLNNIIDDFTDEEFKESSLYKKSETKIGIICDEFLYYSLKDAADFEYISYSENLTVNTNLDYLLVVSSWRGLDHTWDYVANPNGEKRKSLISLINKYNESDIPTVFYSKEDPISYNEYLSIAKVCQYIFTSAKEVIEDYKRDTANNNVDFLEFGVNPMYHNPIGKNLADEKLNKLVTFAGSWMVRFPERNREALEIFNGVNKTNNELCIIDRQYERAMKRYHFPTYLLGNVSATIPHERLMKLHKATSWGINLNSVKDSQTMFANRVYELQAMGNVVVSNYNIGVHLNFPHILMAGSSNDVENIFHKIDEKQKQNLIARGISEVMLNHTAYHRIAKLNEKIGLTTEEIKPPRILVVGVNNQAYDSFENQLYTNKEYIKFSDFNHLDSYDDYEFICHFTDKRIYEEYYLENLLSAFVYTEADIITMNKDQYQYSNKEQYIEDLSMIKTSIYNELSVNYNNLKFFNIPISEVALNETKKYTRSHEDIIDIIIPLREEEQFLEFKSLHSLTDKSLAEKINIYILNIGSINKEKTKIINRIMRKHSNVKVIDSVGSSFNDSVAEILNLNSSNYIMFLNPQNEIISNKLLEIINHTLGLDNDMVISESYNPINKNTKNYKSEILRDYDTLNKSISSVILKSEYASSLFGNDEELTEETMLLKALVNTDRKHYTNLIYHNNFQFLEDNHVGKDENYLQNVLNYEKKMKLLMDEINVLDEYVNEIFTEKFINEYFEFFKSSNNNYESYITLSRILDLYLTHYNKNHEKFNSILDLLF